MTTDAPLPETAVLPTEECWDLLRGDSVGRLAVWVNSRTREPLDSVGHILFPWETVRKDHFLRVEPESGTGRRFNLAAPLTWGGPLDEATRAGLG
ncbi:hypothetical protein NFC73_06505 [Pseudarthrobacter sp. RMG13]|uniref:Uncharacterized protein n=1 Tax=Pseudarthrobacter humi TaxID=2952523 RepID=A0ABT1LLR1_9MICC|nr:hypothetical protein [Pseudarthrobacter humi]MCP8999390.1 hypothetical protein [Pseudarthrobacter humi]